jgi:hypothetical protein
METKRIDISNTDQILEIFVKFGDKIFCVEVSNEGGASVSPVDGDGNPDKQSAPGAWIDPYQMNHKEDYEEGEGDVLKVHAYSDASDEPCSFDVTKGSITLVNVAGGTMDSNL